jgi:hypothetical protein
MVEPYAEDGDAGPTSSWQYYCDWRSRRRLRVQTAAATATNGEQQTTAAPASPRSFAAAAWADAAT